MKPPPPDNNVLELIEKGEPDPGDLSLAQNQYRHHRFQQRRRRWWLGSWRSVAFICYAVAIFCGVVAITSIVFGELRVSWLTSIFTFLMLVFADHARERARGGW